MDFHPSGKDIEEQDLLEFEARHQVTLPDDYRRFMLACNGGMPVDIALAYVTSSGLDLGLLQLYSLKDDYPYDLDHMCVSLDWEEAYDRGYLQIGHDAGGSGFFLSARGDDQGSIYYFDREEACRPPEGAVKIADSFRKFITGFHPVP